MSASQREVLHEEGVVTDLATPTSAGMGRVRVLLTGGDHCEGCPASAICRPDDGERRFLDVLDPVGVAVGDRVRVAVPGGAVLRASFLVYGLPLLLLVVGVAVGMRIWPAEETMRDLYSFVLGAGLAAAAVPVVARMARDAEAAGAELLEPRVAEKLVTVATLGAES
jgi:sigma-E factor negative regulatory protein RseC